MGWRGGGCGFGWPAERRGRRSWHRHGSGWAFRCRHILPDPDYPGGDTFLQCHGSDGPSRNVYATPEAAMIACEQATARGLPTQNTSPRTVGP